MKLDYGLFMAESDGQLYSRESRIQSAIKELIKLHNQGVYINLSSVQQSVWEKYDLEIMSEQECERIKRAVEREIF